MRNFKSNNLAIKTYLVTLIALLLSSNFIYCQSVNLNKGLIAYFPFNENADDKTGYNHGTIHGAKVHAARCDDYSYYFDGIDDYIDCGNHKILNGNFSGLTLSAWVRAEYMINGEFGTIIGKWGFDPVKDHFGLWINENYKVVMAVGDPRKMENGLFSRTMLQTDVWYHIIAVWHRNRKMEIYIDGKIDNRGIQTGNGINRHSPVSLKLGRQVNRKNRPFHGYIDEVRIYNRALSEKEITALHNLDKSACEKIILTGNVYNKKDGTPVPADVIFETLNTGDELKRVKTEGTDCKYETTLPIGYKLGFYANNDQYISINENIDTKKFSTNQVIYKDLYVVPIEVGESLTLNNIFFDFAKANLRKESYSELNRLLKLFDLFPNLTIEISGHTDSIGSDEDNMVLSEDRANSVRDYLLSKNVDPFQVMSKGYGESVPVATNQTDEGRQFNRRVEFKILSK